jgi:ubiquitin carboxyl-terminal hydrolase 36/42
MRHGRQEDAHEFLRFLVEALQKSADGGREIHRSSPNPITRIFSGRFEGLIKCKSCGHESRTHDPFCDLSLDITHGPSLQAALKKFTGIDYLTGANRYKCSNCHKLADAEKSLSIYKAPPVLCVQLKRFRYTSFGSSRIGKHVDFSDTLDLSPFLAAESRKGNIGPNMRYNLQAALIHAGNSPNSGHYYCYIKSPAGVWFRMDDEEVIITALNVISEL